MTSDKKDEASVGRLVVLTDFEREETRRAVSTCARLSADRRQLKVWGVCK